MESTSRAPVTTRNGIITPPFAEFDNIEGCYAWHCLEKANASCAEPEHCCSCRCDKPGFPVADVKNKKCIPFVVKTTATTKSSAEANEVCKDLKTDCLWLEGLGECDTNPTYMRKNCPKSCNMCAKPATTVATAATTSAECKDTNTKCGSWAKRGDCQTEPKYMMTFCIKSCTNCTGKSLVSSAPFTVLPSNGPTSKNSSLPGIPPKAPLKHSAPVAAIAGSIAGIVVLIVCIAIVCFILRRQRKRSKSNENIKSGQAKNGNNTQHGSAPLLSTNQQQHEDIEMREAENPYYKSADGPVGAENHYHSPSDIFQGVHAPNQHDVYYSSADVVKPTTEKEVNQKRGNEAGNDFAGPNQEYSYAFSDAPKLRPTNHENQYSSLGHSSDEPGLYETLQKPADPSNLDFKTENLSYKPTSANKASLDPKSDVNRGLSMKNNAGSRENVSQEHILGKQGSKEYEDLTTPRQNPVYEPIMQQGEEYLDMSVGDGSRGGCISGENISQEHKERKQGSNEYQGLTNPRQNPIYEPLMQQGEEYLDMSVGDGSGGGCISGENVSQEHKERKQGSNEYQDLTVPRQNPIYEPLMQQGEEYLDMSAGDASADEYLYVDPSNH